MSGTINILIQKNSAGTWLALPAGREGFQKAMNEIGAIGSSDMTIGQYKTKLAALPVEILMRADLNIVNYMAARLDGLSPDHVELLEAMLESPLKANVLQSIERVIDFTHNIGVYEVYHGVHGTEDLARYYINESGLIQMPPEWAEGIDLERFGKNLEKQEPGYYTRHGYLIATGLAWTPNFEKSGEVPSEYRIAP